MLLRNLAIYTAFVKLISKMYLIPRRVEETPLEMNAASALIIMFYVLKRKNRFFYFLPSTAAGVFVRLRICWKMQSGIERYLKAKRKMCSEDYHRWGFSAFIKK